MNQGIILATNEGTSFVGLAFMPQVRGEIQGAFVAEVRHSLDCVRTGDHPLITAEDALVALRMADARSSRPAPTSPC